MRHRLAKLFGTESPVIVVGCGGTGGFVAEGLCRLLLGTGRPIALIDHDRVEPHNIARQNFYPGDIGRYKSQVLAERLSGQFGRPVAYAVHLVNGDLLSATQYMPGMYSKPALVIGCVDNPAARQAIATGFARGAGMSPAWWIDSGNDDEWGQVLIGNRASISEFNPKPFVKATGLAEALPLPTVQQPGLLVGAAAPAADCADEIAQGTQGPTINQAMAALVLEAARQVLAGTCTWMAAYINLRAGTLRYVEATPENAAMIWGCDPRRVVYGGYGPNTVKGAEDDD